MEKVGHVLRLCELGFNQRAIARATGVARSSLQEYLRTAEVEGITYEHAALMTDAELREAFKKQRPGRSRIEVTEPNFEQLHKSMMSRKGVTLELLWKEWRATSNGEYSYSTFCRRYHDHIRTTQVVLRQNYTPGELLLSDYAGATLSYWERDDKEHEVQIFVACLGFSNLIYAEASRSQTVADWINSHSRAFRYCGGVTSAVVIDNLKAGVTKSDRYEPDINDPARKRYAIEIKSATDVAPADLGSGFESLAAHGKLEKRICVTNGVRPYSSNGIEFMPWREVFEWVRGL
jgi:transposase